MKAWQLVAVYAGSREALQALLEDDRLARYLRGARRPEDLVRPDARRRLNAELPVAICVDLLKHVPASFPPRTEAGMPGWLTPPDPPTVLRQYVDLLITELEAKGDSHRASARTLSLAPGSPANELLKIGLMWVAVTLLLPLYAVFMLLGLLLGPGRGSAQAHRRIRRTAKAMSAYDGRLLQRTSGSGVFGEGPHWSGITTLRHGTAADVKATQLDRAIRAGYQPDTAQMTARGFSFPRAGRLPAVSVTVVEESRLIPERDYVLAYPVLRRPGRRSGPALVLVPVLAAAPAEHGQATRADGRPYRYILRVPPFVPVGYSVVMVSFNEPPTRRP